MKPITHLRLNTVENCRKTLARKLRWYHQLDAGEQEDEHKSHVMFLAYMKEILSYFKQETEQDVEKRLKRIEAIVDTLGAKGLRAVK